MVLATRFPILHDRPDTIPAAARQAGINAHGNADSTDRADEADRSVTGTRGHASL